AMVETVHGKAGFESGLREAAHVTGFARALQAMRENHLAPRRALRALGLHEHLHVRLGAVQFRLERVARGVEPARPEIPRDGENVVVRYDRTKRPQFFILVSCHTEFWTPISATRLATLQKNRVPIRWGSQSCLPHSRQ